MAADTTRRRRHESTFPGLALLLQCRACWGERNVEGVLEIISARVNGLFEHGRTSRWAYAYKYAMYHVLLPLRGPNAWKSLFCRWLLPGAVGLMNMVDILFLFMQFILRIVFRNVQARLSARLSHCDHSDSHRIAAPRHPTQARPHLQAVVPSWPPLSYGSRRRKCHVADTLSAHPKVTRCFLLRGVMAKTPKMVVIRRRSFVSSIEGGGNNENEKKKTSMGDPPSARKPRRRTVTSAVVGSTYICNCWVIKSRCMSRGENLLASVFELAGSGSVPIRR